MKQTELSIVRVDAPIIPNHSLGGFTLRNPIRDYQEHFTTLAVAGEMVYKLPRLFEARYQLAHGAIAVACDVRNGKIFRVSAYEGYQGLLFDKIALGMSVREAIALVPELYYDEAEETILCKGCEGVALDVQEIDPPPELVKDLTLHAINVFAPEIMNRRGQDGVW